MRDNARSIGFEAAIIFWPLSAIVDLMLQNRTLMIVCARPRYFNHQKQRLVHF